MWRTMDVAAGACSASGRSLSGICSGPPHECRRTSRLAAPSTEPLLLCPAGSLPADDKAPVSGSFGGCMVLP